MPTNPRIPDPLDAESLVLLRALIASAGEHAAAAQLGIPRSTMARAAAGIGIRAGTAALIRQGLEGK